MMKKAVIFIMLLLLSASFACCESLSGLTVTYLDVGQGDAILVQCDGQAMMIDGGDYLYSLQVLSFLKNSLPYQQGLFLWLLQDFHTQGDPYNLLPQP